MRAYLFGILIVILIISVNSCRKDFNLNSSTGNLEFSKDTVFLDTIFSNISSDTYTLKVYNNSNDDLEIPNIQLGQGEASYYRLNVDGVAGKSFENIPIYANDSLYIFIETTVDASDSSNVKFLYTDVIQFDTSSNLQEVSLITLVKDASFLFPKTLVNGSKESVSIGLDDTGTQIIVPGFIMKEEQLLFTNDKPYVIYGYAVVPSGKKLIINAGARIHFHNNSGIYISENAEIHSKGELSENQELLENEVIFEGDRLAEEFSDLSGQWGSILISPGSSTNKINFTTIKNATIGLTVSSLTNSPETVLQIDNSKIYNNSNGNIWAETSSINATNLVLGNTGGSSLKLNGGAYNFTHTTLANYWNKGFRSNPTLSINNYNNKMTEASLQANFNNCIIDGNSRNELNLNAASEADFDFVFINCLLKVDDVNGDLLNNPLYDFQNENNYLMPFINQMTDFLNPVKNDFNIGINSAAVQNANLEAALLVPLDILGQDRILSPDIGAYQNTRN